MITIFKKDLNKNIYLSAELFKGQIKVHIREYGINSQGLLYPTRKGVTMDLLTWYEFYSKLSSFNLCYASASYIANNSTLVLNVNNVMQIQSLSYDNFNKQPIFIQLDSIQLTLLNEYGEEMNNNIIDYLLTKRFAHFVQRERRLLPILLPEDEDNLMPKFIISVENELRKIFQQIYQCNGCIIDHPSQTQHACLNTSDLSKYLWLGDKVLLLVDIEALALNFVSSIDYISQNFLTNICVTTLKDVLFKKMY